MIRRVRRIQWTRERVWVAVTVVSFLLHATWGALDFRFYTESTERRQDSEQLSCALATYFQTISEVVSVRNGPGDNRIGPATTDVINAALARARDCPAPPSSPLNPPIKEPSP